MSVFKHDIVGSFLRPQNLHQARKDFTDNKITQEQLTKTEDLAIKDLINKQINAGLEAVTDGEFRRKAWHSDFIIALNGITAIALPNQLIFQGVESDDLDSYAVTDKISFPQDHPFLDHFKFVKDNAQGKIAKQTIPGPLLLSFPGSVITPNYLKNSPYTSIEEFHDDVIQVYKDVIQAFYNAGCRYLQIDDTTWNSIADKKSEQAIKDMGYTVDELIQKFAEITEACLVDKPKDMTISFHTCRGNFKSSWLYEGTYDTISKALFSIDAIDGFFLEYDSDRAGDFTPLKELNNQKIVLGLVTTKAGELESIDSLLKRVHQANKHVPIDQICVSPQCGFASTHQGNALTEEEQWKKIDLVVKLANSY